MTLDQVIKEHIYNTLAQCKWNKTYAAKVLGIGRQTLYEKIKKYSLKRPYEQI